MRAAAAPSRARARAEVQGLRRQVPVQFIRECWAGLGRVQWPDRNQLWQATAVVILACFVVGVYLYALDSASPKWPSGW